MNTEIRDEIDSAKEFYAKEMPANVRKAINLCSSHLWSGPLYFDADGEQCGCFDEGARQFDWNPSLDLIREWADGIPDVEAEESFNEDTGQSTYCLVEGSREEILRTLVGRELMRYV